MAIPKQNLLELKYLNSIKSLLNSIYTKSLCRIYAVFNKHDIWFKDIPKTTINNNSRYIIPLDKENGSIMISYSDSKFADYWYNLGVKNKKMLLHHLKKNIMKTYGIKINNPIFLKAFYWKYAIGFWKCGKDSSIISKKICHPFLKQQLYICGENYSETEGWIEGALETSEIVIKKIIKDY